ncbi:MAG: phenylacetic acid degradation bifunctional protein PaaZ [Anaerolineales bacterium]
MITLKSYLSGQWRAGTAEPRTLKHAITGEPIAQCSSEGLDLRAALDYARTVGGPKLRAMTFQERAALLKKMCDVLNQHLPEFHDIAYTYGVTKADATGDIEGGIFTLGTYASLGRKNLPNAQVLADGDAIPMSKGGGFGGQHLWVSREGVLIQINAYNYPAWGMLEKLGPSLLAGVPSLVKPAVETAWLTHRMVEVLIESGVMPEGALQLLCGSVGDLLDHVTGQDMIAFTGSAKTAQKIRLHPTVARHAVRLNVETDSLNSLILAPDVDSSSPLFTAFIKTAVTEMTHKSGQRCTCVRRILVPQEREAVVINALKAELSKVHVGDPRAEGVTMGALINQNALRDVRGRVAALLAETEIVFGDPQRAEFQGGTGHGGAFMEPILLRARATSTARAVNEVEAFGPVATVMAYRDLDHAIEIAKRGEGSLVASVYTTDEAAMAKLTLGLAPYHGRLLMITNEAAANESTGHGTATPVTVHGGPGRAGGGEELGGLRAVYHFMQRVAVQGDPQALARLVTNP